MGGVINLCRLRLTYQLWYNLNNQPLVEPNIQKWGMTVKKTLILGGGIGGVESAIFLRKEGFEVTLISNRDYFYVYPLSIWIPTGEIEFEDTCLPLKDLAEKHGFQLIIDEVLQIEAEGHRVLLKEMGEYRDYDYLIIALGGGKLKPKGAEHALSICEDPKISLVLKDKLEKVLAKGEGKLAVGFGGNPKDNSAVRGGPAFEFILNLDHLLRKRKLRDKFELTFFAPMENPGAKMGDKAVKETIIWFDKLNIKMHVGKKIKEFEEDGVRFEDDSKLLSDYTMFISAGTGHKAIEDSDLPVNESGFITINRHCQVEGYDNIFAVGDAAALEGPQWKSKQGHIAELMARNTAVNISNIEKGSPERESYVEHLSILCVMDSGNGAAYVHRDDQKEVMVKLPVVGHWLKKGWGVYYKLAKMGKIPRIPGM